MISKFYFFFCHSILNNEYISCFIFKNLPIPVMVTTQPKAEEMLMGLLRQRPISNEAMGLMGLMGLMGKRCMKKVRFEVRLHEKCAV